MNYNEVAKILAESLPYIQKYRGKTIVVKYGGNAMIDEELKKYVINDLVLMKCVGINLVVVHGGGPFISSYLKKLNKESVFIDGLRYTDDETMDIVQMVLSGKINKDLVKLIQSYGGKAIGLCGLDGAMIRAKKLCEKVDLGRVGEITEINTEVIKNSIDSGYIPVISSVALANDNEGVYNINADTCSYRIASALKAQNLILLTDVPGVMTDIKDPSTLISELKLKDISKLYDNNIIKGGMLPKINCCVEAIKSGVKSAHIIDGRVPHCLLVELFSKQGIGTMIY
ncbi:MULTISPECIES: acetylglutamate kinase [Clostridium]|uniref:Acetylglutamate kinase n=4 Tax=Clostridium TaxID=1485 RepID=D8GJQ1_CLOLD|nr:MULTISPECIES: acetylglutamate kinase [Clostridium]ADK15212.1 acetylglutamate kinase [Clostridium ljungdahlii DSM 13528]AGY74472.1 acetylglutamate kinase [Clostridium autoethanogenum DSM 10061]ALU34659.1 Acetylglutamate kinase [Clostridium autoethanogenum DSM 10061]OAA88692.1 Acetylglutamate kinase [Clostridium ljungdahlii DSM 13528]OBR91166.1 acetylglutamate kinase [Clostridium ragsdalei P11]